jgi:hypothetical protein
MLTNTDRAKGGRALIHKEAPAHCPKCGKSFPFQTPYHSYLGHLGLHGLADRYFGGDLKAAQRRLRENGMARQDPAVWNGAFKPYRPIGDS